MPRLPPRRQPIEGLEVSEKAHDIFFGSGLVDQVCVG